MTVHRQPQQSWDELQARAPHLLCGVCVCLCTQGPRLPCLTNTLPSICLPITPGACVPCMCALCLFACLSVCPCLHFSCVRHPLFSPELPLVQPVLMWQTAL